MLSIKIVCKYAFNGIFFKYFEETLLLRMKTIILHFLKFSFSIDLESTRIPHLCSNQCIAQICISAYCIENSVFNHVFNN